MKANALSRLADRLRLNAASMEHGEAEADIRAAADILDSFAGECYEIVLMPLRHDMLTCEISIADAVTGELVQDYGTVSGSLDHLRFGNECEVG